MNYRNAQILAAEDLGASGTKVIDIDIQKPISRITVRFKTTRAAITMAAPAPANISKIELVDGSRRLFSLTGYEAEALGYYNRPGSVFDHGQHINTQSEVDIYPIDFGRYLWDPLLALDPLKFANPQLRITYDEDVADTSVTSNECEVWADVFDDKTIAPVGFLSAIEHHSYTPGADGSYETISLPDDRPIRQMLVRAHYDGYEPWYQVDEARFDEGTLDKIAWEYTDLEYYYRRMKSVWKPIVLPLAGHAYATASVFYIPQSDYWASVNLTAVAATAEYYITGASAKGGKVSVIGSADTNFVGVAHGFLPWSTFQFGMGNPDDIDDWYDPTGKKPRLRLRAGAGATNGDVQVVLEELWKY